MKKIYLILLALISIIGFSFVNAQDAEDPFFTEWWYKDGDQIVVKEVGPDYVILESPVIKDAIGETVTTYRIIYSTKPIDSANIDITDLNDKKIVVDNIEWDTVTLKLDGLTPNTTYYIAIEPEDALGEAGAISNQVEVTTKWLEETNQDMPHQAANMEILSNITYTYTGNVITVTWNAVEGVDKVQVFIKKEDQNDFTKVVDIAAWDGKVEIPVSEKGLYIVKLVPVDNQENILSDGYNISVKVEQVKPVTIKNPPKVWPTTNLILFAILLMILWYLLFRLYRKS